MCNFQSNCSGYFHAVCTWSLLAYELEEFTSLKRVIKSSHVIEDQFTLRCLKTPLPRIYRSNHPQMAFVITPGWTSLAKRTSATQEDFILLYFKLKDIITCSAHFCEGASDFRDCLKLWITVNDIKLSSEVDLKGPKKIK